MSLSERIIGRLFSPLTSAVNVKFNPEIKAQTIYPEDVNPVKEDKVTIEKGSRMAFSYTGPDGRVRAIVIDDYRGRRWHTPGAKVSGAELRGGEIIYAELAKLSPENPRVEIKGVGVFHWEE